MTRKDDQGLIVVMLFAGISFTLKLLADSFTQIRCEVSMRDTNRWTQQRVEWLQQGVLE
jgi:hypothetical protein